MPNLKNTTQITPLTVKGGLVRVIDSATGDIERTTSGWIEDPKYLNYNSITGTVSAKFDSSTTRTGKFTLKMSTLASASFCETFLSGTRSYTSRIVPVLPSTQYTFTGWMKTNYVSGSARGAAFGLQTLTPVTTSLDFRTTEVSTTTPWTSYTSTFTTGASDAFVIIRCYNYGHSGGAANLIMDAWFDENSISLVQTSSITNSSSSPALFYPKVTTVTSTNNIDQSQVASAGSIAFGNAIVKRVQSFIPTKKHNTGFTIQRGSNVGSPVSNVVVTLEADSAGFPSGIPLETVTIPAASWDAITTNTDYNVVFPSTYDITIDGTTKYWMVITATGTLGDGSNYRTIRIQSTNVYANGTEAYFDSTWHNETKDLYFKTLYSKNTTNLTVSTDTETVSVTAPTADGWADGTVVNFTDALTLAPGANAIYVASNGPATADGTVDPSLQGILGGIYGTLCNSDPNLGIIFGCYYH